MTKGCPSLTSLRTTGKHATPRALAHAGAVILTAPAMQAEALSQAIGEVPVIGVDRDVLRVYGEVRKFLRSGDYLHAHIDVREAAQ